MDRISYAAGVRQRPVNLADTPTFAPISDRGDGDLGPDVTSRVLLELDCQRTKCSFDLFDCTRSNPPTRVYVVRVSPALRVSHLT